MTFQPRSDPTYRVLQLVDHDKQFELNERSEIRPVILNMFEMDDPGVMEELQKNIFSDGTSGDFMAKCSCGHLEGDNKYGMICPVCNTKVEPITLLDENNLVCKNWLSAPSELIYGWLAPKLYLALSNWLSYEKGRKSKRNYLDDILDPDAELPFELHGIVEGRGFTYLYENFERLMQYFAYNNPKISAKADTPAMMMCLDIYKAQIFCHYIPILNAAINPIMSSEGMGANKRNYSDVTADYILRAAITLSQLRFEPKKKNHDLRVARATYKAYKDIIAYTEEATSKYISIKKAIPRMHIFGSRFHWSFRGVVVPIIGDHLYYELHMPWQMAVNSLRVQLHGELLRRGFNTRDAIGKVRRALNVIDDDIRLIMDQLIADSPFPGLPVLWDRPPSIRDGSVMLKYVTKIKTDLEDSCIGMTPLDVGLPNADFDGDNLAGIFLFEVEMVKAMRAMSPAALIYDRNNGGITSEIGIHKTTSITWNSVLGNV